MEAEARPKTIVVATDFSEDAGAAVAWAEHIARQHQARLVLAHASVPTMPPAPEFVIVPPEYFAELHAIARKRLDGAAADLRKGGLVADSELVVGPAVTGILEVAERQHADLLVIGTRGRTGWRRMLLGSTAARVVRDARCPVVTVHPTDAGPPRPIRTVLVPTDFSEDATRAAEVAARALVTEGPRRLVLVHAFRLPIETEHLPARMLIDAIQAAEHTARAQIEALAAKLERPGLTIESFSREGYPVDVVLEHARVVRPDLIAMGTHGRSGLDRLFLGSTTERVLPSAPCPVLTVRRDDDDDL